MIAAACLAAGIVAGTTGAVAQVAEGDLGLGAPSAVQPASPAPARFDPDKVLADVDPRAPMDTDRARELQEAVRIAREDAADALLRERIACYRRFFVYRCWADVEARERTVRAKLDRIEVAANRTLREAKALELNERTASSLAEREATSESDALRREENARQYTSRQEAAANQAAQREAEADDLARRTEANRAERERREAEARARREEADRRATQDAANAAARARALEARRVEREASERREAERRATRQEDRARRDAEAKAREESPPPPRRPGARPAGERRELPPIEADTPSRPAPTLPGTGSGPSGPTVTPMR